MKTVKLYETGEEVLVKAKVSEVAMDNGDIVYQVTTIDNGKNMGVWLKDEQLIPMPVVSNFTTPIVEGGIRHEGIKDQEMVHGNQGQNRPIL